MTQHWASALNQRVEIQRAERTVDELGGASVAWTSLATVWAQVQPLNSAAREREVAGQVVAWAGYRVRLRVRADMHASMRLLWKQHVLVIHSLHERGEVLDILAYEEHV